MKTLLLIPILFIALSLSAQTEFTDGITTVESGTSSMAVTTSDNVLANSLQNNYNVQHYENYFDNDLKKMVYTFIFSRNEKSSAFIFERITLCSKMLAVK